MQYIFDLFLLPIGHNRENLTCLWLLFGGRDTRSMTVVERHVLRPSYDAAVVPSPYKRKGLCIIRKKAISHDVLSLRYSPLWFLFRRFLRNRCAGKLTSL